MSKVDYTLRLFLYAAIAMLGAASPFLHGWEQAACAILGTGLLAVRAFIDTSAGDRNATKAVEAAAANTDGATGSVVTTVKETAVQTTPTNTQNNVNGSLT